jgi:hypothetical protein
VARYREGVVLKAELQAGEGSHIDVGLPKEIVIDRRLKPGVRVTVKMDSSTRHQKVIRGCTLGLSDYRPRLRAHLPAVVARCSPRNQPSGANPPAEPRCK